MAAEKALALVVRGHDWSETSRITTLFTREFGKVRGLAKGGRRLGSNFEIAFDLLTVCHIVFLRKAHGGLDLLTEAQVAERFPVLRQNLPALYAGYYVAELLADGTQDYDPHPALFDAGLETLRSLEAGESPAVATAGLGAGLARFELVWLRELGYSPRLDECAACGAGIPPPPGGRRLAFSPAAGGVVCPACEPGARDRRPLSAPAWSALRAMAAREDAGGGPADPPDGVRAEVRQVLGQAVAYVLGRRPRLLGYLDGP